MIDRFRNWLAGVLATPPIATDAVRPPEVPKKLPKARTSMADVPVAPPARDSDDLELRQAAKRLRETEQRAQKAEDRAKRAEAARSELETSSKSAEARVTAALDRAKRAEQALKKAADTNARAGKKRRGKNDNVEAELRIAEGRARSLAQRAAAAEASLAEAEQRAKSHEQRARELAAKTDQLEKRAIDADAAAASAARSSPALPEPSKDISGSKEREASRDRGRPTTQVEAYFSPGDECLQSIRRQFEQAQRTVDVCVFTITDDRIAAAILDAHRRGVRVRVITDNDKAHDEGSDVRRLERAGMEVREDRTECHMHHKFAIFDGRAVLTGSYNWTRGAARNNEENLVVSNDPRLVGPFEREFNALWGRFADPALGR